MKKVIVIAGVTGSGKTRLGIEVAKRYNGEIISADSVAIYKHLDIGSAKPTPAEQALVKHHMIDILDINQTYSVADFQKTGRALIDDLSKANKIPVVVGGTGLYINALINNYTFLEESESAGEPDHYDALTNEVLYQMVLEKDPNAQQTIHPNNRKRLLRALRRESSTALGHEPVYDALVFFIQGDRDILYERINQRVVTMIDAGLVEEVRALYQKDTNLFGYQALQSIGYREFKPFMEGEQSLDDTIALIQKNTRNFAKRQITWFKNKTQSTWIDVHDTQAVFPIIDAWLNQN